MGADEGGPASSAEASPATVACWRCGKPVERAWESCPYCRAFTRDRRAAARLRAERVRASSPLPRVLVVFAGLLASSLVYGSLIQFGLSEPSPTEVGARRRLDLVLGLELVDTVLVGLALAWVGRLPPAAPALRPLGVWSGAAALLVGLLSLNYGYHLVLRQYLRVSPEADAIMAGTGVTPLVVLAYCVQPAVVEELFFRYVALGALRAVTSLHAAVVISSVMFGVAHIGVPLSIPMLTVVGLGLGYARVASGGLSLPIAMHFLHNAAILALSP